MDEEILHALPPLIDDFDSWLQQSSICNPSVFDSTASNFHYRLEGEVSIKLEQKDQTLQVDEIESFPALLDDFDSWFNVWPCNFALPCDQFRVLLRRSRERWISTVEDDFGDYELLNMVEEANLDDYAFSGHDGGGFRRDYEVNTKLLPLTGTESRNDDSILQNGFDEAGKLAKAGRIRNSVGSERAKDISFTQLSRYFYMPITQAAKKMNIGLTVLKKKCREFGIPRWPHRKMKSLRSLIDSVQELGKDDGSMGFQRSRVAVEVLEEQVRQMEKMPATEMSENTKRLRQACFKANYKKRRLVTQENSTSFYTGSSS